MAEAAQAALCSQQLLLGDDGLRLHAHQGPKGAAGSEDPSCSSAGSQQQQGDPGDEPPARTTGMFAHDGGTTWLQLPSRAEPAEAAREVTVQRSAASRVSKRPGYGRGRLLETGSRGRRRLVRDAKLWLRCKASELDGALPIIHPRTAPKVAWDVFIMTLVIYVAITIPVDISFGMSMLGNTLSYVDWAIDGAFFIDILLSFRTAYWDSQGHLVQDSHQIARTYLSFWFPIDLLATIPWDLLAMGFGLDGEGGTAAIVLAFLKTPRLLRLGRLLRLLDHVKHIQSLKVVLLVLGMMMTSHWLACTWFCMYKFSSFAPSPSDWAFDVYHNGSLLSYWLSAYYQCFLLLLGNTQVPLNNAERVFFTICGILGTCLYAAVVGQMVLLVASMNIVSIRHKQRQDLVTHALSYSGAPNTSLRSVDQYFTYIMQYNHPTSEGVAFFNELPRALCQDLSGALFEPLLRKLPLLVGVDQRCIARLALKMRLCVVAPKQVLCRFDDPVPELFILHRGSAAVLQSLGHMVAMLQPGDSWGGMEAVAKVHSLHHVVALHYCDLLMLSATDMWAALRDFPACTARIQVNATDALCQEQERFCIYVDDWAQSDSASGADTAAAAAAGGVAGGAAGSISPGAREGPDTQPGAEGLGSHQELVAGTSPRDGAMAKDAQGSAITAHADLLDLAQSRRCADESVDGLTPVSWGAAAPEDAVIHVKFESVDRQQGKRQDASQEPPGEARHVSMGLTSHSSLGAALDTLQQPLQGHLGDPLTRDQQGRIQGRDQWHLAPPPYVGADAWVEDELSPAQAGCSTSAGTALLPVLAMPQPAQSADVTQPLARCGGADASCRDEARLGVMAVGGLHYRASTDSCGSVDGLEAMLRGLSAVRVGGGARAARGLGRGADGALHGDNDAWGGKVVRTTQGHGLSEVEAEVETSAQARAFPKPCPSSPTVPHDAMGVGARAGAAVDMVEGADGSHPSGSSHCSSCVEGPQAPQPPQPPHEQAATSPASKQGRPQREGVGEHGHAEVGSASSAAASAAGSAALHASYPDKRLQGQPLGEGVEVHTLLEECQPHEAHSTNPDAGAAGSAAPHPSPRDRQGLLRWLSDQDRLAQAIVQQQACEREPRGSSHGRSGAGGPQGPGHTNSIADSAVAAHTASSPPAPHCRAARLIESGRRRSSSAGHGPATTNEGAPAQGCAPVQVGAHLLPLQHSGEQVLLGLSHWLSQPTAKHIRHKPRRLSAISATLAPEVRDVSCGASGREHEARHAPHRRSSQAGRDAERKVAVQDETAAMRDGRQLADSRRASLAMRVGSMRAMRTSTSVSRPSSGQPLSWSHTHRTSDAVRDGPRRRSSVNYASETLSRASSAKVQPSERERQLERENEELKAKLACARQEGKDVLTKLMGLAGLVDAMACKVEGLEADLEATHVQMIQLEGSLGVPGYDSAPPSLMAAGSLLPHSPLATSGLRVSSIVMARDSRPAAAGTAAAGAATTTGETPQALGQGRGSMSWSGPYLIPGVDTSVSGRAKAHPWQRISVDASAPHRPSPGYRPGSRLAGPNLAAPNLRLEGWQGPARSGGSL